MKVSAFGKEFITAAERTLTQEFTGKNTEVHKVFEILVNALMNQVVKVCIWMAGVFSFIYGLIYALHQWFQIEVWITSWMVTLTSLIVLSFMKERKVLHDYEIKR